MALVSRHSTDEPYCYVTVFAGDLGNDLAEVPTKRRVPLPEFTLSAATSPATDKEAERAAARQSLNGGSEVPMSVLVAVLDGLRRL